MGLSTTHTNTEDSMLHANARFTPAGRLSMVQRIESGMPQAHVARQMGLSRGTVAKWCFAAGARRVRPGWWTGPRGLAGRLGAPPPESRSGSAVCVAARGKGLYICRREPGCRPPRSGGSLAATGEPPVVDRPAHRPGDTPLRAQLAG